MIQLPGYGMLTSMSRAVVYGSILNCNVFVQRVQQVVPSTESAVP